MAGSEQGYLMKEGVRKTSLFLFAVLLFFMFTVLLNRVVQPEGEVLAERWYLLHDDALFEVTLPFQVDLQESQTVIYESTFPHPRTEDPALVLVRPLSNGMKVFINGALVFQVGDLKEATGNLWNSSFAIPLPLTLYEKNSIRIESASLMNTGLTVKPYLLPRDAALRRVSFLNFLFSDLILYFIGGALFLSGILLVIFRSRASRNKIFFFIALASLAAAIYGLDYPFRAYTFSRPVYFWIKKLFMIAGFCSAGLFLYTLDLYTGKRLIRGRTILIIVLVLSLGFLVSWSFPVFLRYFYGAALVLMVLLGASVVSLYHLQKEHEIFILPFVWLIMSLIQVNAVNIFHLSTPLTLQYIIILDVVVFGFYMIAEFYRFHAATDRLRTGVYEDPLTGVYNRTFLKELDMSRYTRLVLVDLDNFKSYNDTYGHHRGDQALRCFTTVVQKHLEEGDIILRYGGDEFLLFLRNRPREGISGLMKSVQREFLAREADGHLGFSYGISPMEGQLEAELRCADRAMYAMKANRRPR